MAEPKNFNDALAMEAVRFAGLPGTARDGLRQLFDLVRADERAKVEAEWAQRIAELEAEDDRLSNLCRDYKIAAEAAARAAERAKVLAELWAWLEKMPETYDFQCVGEKLSELQKP